jgi:hypothetical protein
MKSVGWVSILVLLLGGCTRPGNNYEIIEGKGGQIYRVNRATGQLDEVREGRLMRILNETETDPEATRRQALARAKEWAKLTLSTKEAEAASLRTSWRDGQLYYSFAVEPNTRAMDNSPLGTFTIYLLDEGGFSLQDIEIRISSMTRIVDAEGKPTSRSGQGHVALPMDKYAAIANWTITWAF